MRTKLFCLFFLVNSISFCKAQDSTAVLDTLMFDKYFQTIPLTGLNSWIFKQGNDTNWAKNEIDTSGWMKLNPVQLSSKNTDRTGRLEGWLRLRFRLDSSFENVHVGIAALRWAATDIYIDGNYIASYGSTGLDGRPYAENMAGIMIIQPLQLETRKEHILAVHIVDYVAPLNHRFLKTASFYNSFSSLILLTGPSAYKNTIGSIRERAGYFFLFSGIIGFLTVLFWFLYFQNRNDKNILFISISTSFFFVWVLFVTISAYAYPFDLDFKSWWIIFYIGYQSWPLAIASMIYTVGGIFTFKYKKALVIFGLVFVVSSLVTPFLNYTDPGIDPYPLTAIALLLYITVTSWKRLRGAQWAIVAGIISTAIFSFLWAYFFHHYNQSLVFPHVYFYQSAQCLSLPISLMIYVVMRFKEILTEVQVNAKQVIQLSEEKKEQALSQQKILEEEVARQTIELRTSLEDLKATQAQLIQSEKMASLGELTAGIAHEIQNPLNFVNNFSEVNTGLLSEMKEAIHNKNYEEASSIADDVMNNEEKISHHGKRADSIVKGMLQHSRSSTGQKEPTDINALADEYLRLAYHGLRAKDSSFNATIKTDFDPSIGKINIVPQDIGRVLLNMFNNAFYAVTPPRLTPQPPKGGADYEPTVSLTTRLITPPSGGRGGVAEIRISDNGSGIPQKILDKIFQPFFTTKPAGQGTGLGLSLSYDIVKAHGGEIKVETREEEGTVFVVQLPV
jgi:signal transduction histidine kinase